MASTRQQVLRGFRRLLRARKVLFRNDAYALAASQKELRSHFQNNRHESDPTKIQEMLRGIEEAEDMLRNHFVQGRLTEQGTYAATIPGGEHGQTLQSLTTEDLERMAKEVECDVTVHKHSPNR